MSRKSMKQVLEDAEALERRLEMSPGQLAEETIGTMEDRPDWYDGMDDAIDEVASAFESDDLDSANRAIQRMEDRYIARPRPPRRERPRCGAVTRKGTPCKMAAYWVAGEPAPRNGRCRLHGGASTGPITPAGKAAIAASNRWRTRQSDRVVK